ncbi:NAD(P)-binding protein [Karstenula rhodostoma CBS 690.94]|uniref:NAD(P)-binding protein n=1 Tax=Karstenula rhodostoma CBS 690.94 TaxID=1392251 RepID=A0A9P4PNU4_9PLEO|nr:NAD(P)-binding protein [Karstenula rhodostoma CBS 690.94]
MRIFITGSSDGLGSLAAQSLVKRGHNVTLHARNAQRAEDAKTACPGADGVLIADLSSTQATKSLADDLNSQGPWDAIINNAGVMHIPSSSTGPEGLPTLFATNTLAPYMLTCLVQPPPKNLFFLSSALHNNGDATLRDIKAANYNDSKMHITMLGFWFAQQPAFQNTIVSSLDPGWVKTKMGGESAGDDIEAGIEDYVALAEGTLGLSGKHWYHSRERSFHRGAADKGAQEKLVKELREISGKNDLSKTSLCVAIIMRNTFGRMFDDIEDTIEEDWKDIPTEPRAKVEVDMASLAGHAYHDGHCEIVL